MSSETTAAWQPIETAPKDGRTIIVARDMETFGWVKGYARWAGGDGYVSGWVSNGFDPVMSNLGLGHPTHWMPLPANPQPAVPARVFSGYAKVVGMPDPAPRLHWDDDADTQAAIEKDAERYRKLRNASMDERNRLEHYAGPALDAALDATPPAP